MTLPRILARCSTVHSIVLHAMAIAIEVGTSRGASQCNDHATQQYGPFIPVADWVSMAVYCIEHLIFQGNTACSSLAGAFHYSLLCVPHPDAFHYNDLQLPAITTCGSRARSVTFNCNLALSGRLPCMPSNSTTPVDVKSPPPSRPQPETSSSSHSSPASSTCQQAAILEFGELELRLRQGRCRRVQQNAPVQRGACRGEQSLSGFLETWVVRYVPLRCQTITNNVVDRTFGLV